MSTTDTASAPSLRQAALGDLSHELDNTRRVLERVPDEHFAWKPHAKSSSLGALASHVANLAGWGQAMLTTDGTDVLNPASRPPQHASRDAVLAAFDRGAAAVRETLANTPDAALFQPWTLRKGDHVIFTLPRLAALRGMMISHIVHHRAQLSVYLRLLDVPVPGLYGPSADEP
ncbi:MAG TPA: DinB family protein [Longimicrobium sp.]|nr:DinB family protein [Longimicrobium sp.]